MKKLIALMACLVPAFVFAQKDTFLHELKVANDWFLTQPEATLVQTYTYYEDGSLALALDSSVCTLTRNGETFRYQAGTMESFSSGGYVLKADHAAKILYVGRTASADTAQLPTLLNAGFNNFKTFDRIATGGWELGGGTAGITSATLLFEPGGLRIRRLILRMAANHPLISPFRKDGRDTAPAIIKIDYRYSNGSAIPALSEFVSIAEGRISPAPGYRDYDLKTIAARP